MRNLHSKTSKGNVHALDFGELHHEVLIFMHGFPGSHQQAVFLKEHAESLQFRVLAFDRPGYAFSDSVKLPNLENFAHAIEEFLDEHQIKDFRILGVSGGNPTAVACASYFKDRVIALGSICGLAPFRISRNMLTTFQKYGLTLADFLPHDPLEKILDFALSKLSPQKIMSRLVSQVDQFDREVLSTPLMRKVLVQSMETARIQGSKGILFDAKTFSTDWSPHLDQIKCPYFLWHGKKDKILSYEMSVEVNKLVKHSKLKLYETEGHYSLPIKQGREILTEFMKVKNEHNI